MVIVLGYNKEKTEFLDELFENNDIEYKYSIREQDILNSDKIILPHPTDFTSTYRKLSMTNMLSLLRMVQKPILGINRGSLLMCGIIDEKKCGLGFFNLDREYSDHDDNESEWLSGRIKFEKPSKLLDDKFSNYEVFIKETRKPKICENSSILSNINNSSFSILFEQNNYFGLELNYRKNTVLFKEIFLNFLRL